jgi:tetratricopeptide (TPR) repeat protein
MNAYCSALVNDPEHIYDGIKFHAQEIIKICQNIYRDCTEDNLRYSAKAFLCKAYAVIGEREKAVEIANTFPAAGHLTSGQMLESIYEEGSEEKIQQRQINRICLSDALFLNILLTAHQTRDMRERRVWFEKNIRLTELIHDDNNLPHMNLGSIYFNIAKCYMREDNFDMAIETLKKSAEHYIAHDKDSIDTSMKPEMLEYLKEPVVAPIREYEDFKNIVSSLS